MAESVAEAVLSVHGIDEFAALRALVAKQELMRHIKYARQIDHTAHTVYLYLLGVWFYDTIPLVRNEVNRELRQNFVAMDEREEVDDAALAEDFLFAWSYAGLLHDIGYIFYDLSPDTQADRRHVDNIFKWTWLKQQYPDASPAAEDLLRQTYKEFRRRYSKKLPPGTATYAANAYQQVIDRLAAVPWAGYFNERWDGFNGFKILDPPEGRRLKTGLQRYAEEVARLGYNGDRTGRCVDHAVASGLLLLQYASYWYWLMTYAAEIGTEAAVEELHQGLDYDVSNLLSLTVPACRACAYHNVRLGVPSATGRLKEFSLVKSPLLFLSVLCDELQRWDRFAAGAGYLTKWDKYTQYSLESGDIELRAVGHGDSVRAEFSVSKADFNPSELTAAIESRLPDWCSVVDIVG
jgi:hypothetical protein